MMKQLLLKLLLLTYTCFNKKKNERFALSRNGLFHPYAVTTILIENPSPTLIHALLFPISTKGNRNHGNAEIQIPF